MFTAKRPFLPPALFKDRNFVCGVSMVFCTATVMLASSALMAPYLETLADYPVETAGWSLAPRGLGVMIGMQVASRLANRIDHRKLMATGLLTMGSALYSISYWTPDVAQHVMMMTLLVQGFGTGLVFNPMTVVAFITLPTNLRGYATSLQSLCRNLGQAVGVSVTSLMLVRNVHTSHAGIVAGSPRSTVCCRATTRCLTCWTPPRGTARRCSTA